MNGDIPRDLAGKGFRALARQPTFCKVSLCQLSNNRRKTMAKKASSKPNEKKEKQWASKKDSGQGQKEMADRQKMKK
jgi:hypothetical protein